MLVEHPRHEPGTVEARQRDPNHPCQLPHGLTVEKLFEEKAFLLSFVPFDFGASHDFEPFCTERVSTAGAFG
jgi:hypothetical protein